MTVTPIDLIRLEGDGNSVVLRITGTHDRDVLTGELLVESAFVRGSLRMWLFPADLGQWQDVLDKLDAGFDVAWLAGGRSPEVLFERDADHDRVHVTVQDDAGSLTSVRLTIPITDAWFDDAYERLDRIRRVEL